MEVKNEPVDPEYNEEGHPPDDGWYHVPIVQPEALETFEGASFRIKSEFQTEIGEPIFKEEVAPRDCTVDCRVSETDETSSSFSSEIKNQVPAPQKINSSLCQLMEYSQKTSPVSFIDIEIDENNVKNEDIGQRPIVVVINLEKKLFHERNFVCNICLQFFASFDLLSLHKNVHHNSILNKKHEKDLNLCLQLDSRKKGLNLKNDLTSDSQTLNIHKQSQSNLNIHKLSHGREKLLECDQCDYKSSWKSHLKIHKRLHTGEKPFECDQCDYKSARKTRLRDHKLLHTREKPIKKNSRSKTRKLSHTGEKPFECDQCDYKSASKYSLNSHKFLHTGEKPFECDQCDYKSARKTRLRDHKLLHTGEKPFGCDQCDFKSAFSSNLNSHKLSHTGHEKTFECDQCGCKFKRKVHLTVHKLSHTGKKPFECDQCQFKTVWKSHMDTHQYTHKNK